MASHGLSNVLEIHSNFTVLSLTMVARFLLPTVENRAKSWRHYASGPFFSDLGFCMASCSYNILYIYISVTKWRSSGYLDFNQAFTRFVFILAAIWSNKKYSRTLLYNTKPAPSLRRTFSRGPVTKWPPQRLLFTRLEILFAIISSFTKRAKVVHK